MKKLVAGMGLGMILVWMTGCATERGETLEERIDRVSRAEMESVSQLLGHDLFEGRAPGTRGGDLAEISVQALFKFMDLDPGHGDSYYQPFVMKGMSNQGFEVNANGEELDNQEAADGEIAIDLASIEGEAACVKLLADGVMRDVAAVPRD